MTTSVAPNLIPLTAAQTDTLERCADPRTQESLARSYTEHNARQAEFADVPLPHDAVDTDERELDDCPQPWRAFRGSEWKIPDHTEYPMENWSVRADRDLSVQIVGLQASDGTAYRWLDFAGMDITESTLCRIIDSLTAAGTMLRREKSYVQTHTVGA